MSIDRETYFKFKPMADDLRQAEHWDDLDGVLNRNKTVQNLYKMGYRKQSEVVQEVIDFTKVKIAELEDHTPTEELDKATDLVKWILAGVISDLKKKYTEEKTDENISD